MIKRFSRQTKSARVVSACLGALALFAGISVAQNIVAPASLEETAPALPAGEPVGTPDAANATDAQTKPEPAGTNAVEKTAGSPSAAPVVEDYTEKIGTGLKERERRLTLLNEAMMKLREAGETEDAARVEERIRGLLAMPPPSQVNSQLKTELENLRAKNDELIVQMVAMEEELKRFRGTGGTGSIVTRQRR